MFCPNCGSFNEDGSLFCGECGTKLSAPAPVQSDPAPVQEETPAEPVNTNPAPAFNEAPAVTDIPPAPGPVVSESPFANTSANPFEAPQPQPGFNSAPQFGGAAPYGNQNPVPPYTNPVPGGYVPPQPAKKSNSGMIVGIIIAAVVVIGAVVVALLSKGGKTNKPDTTDPTKNSSSVTQDNGSTDENNTDAPASSDSDNGDSDSGSGHYISDYFADGTVYAKLSAKEISNGIARGLTDVWYDYDMYSLDEIHVSMELIESGKDPSGRYLAYLFKATVKCDENDGYYGTTSEEYMIFSVDAQENDIGINEYDFDDYDTQEECLKEAMAKYEYWIE